MCAQTHDDDPRFVDDAFAQQTVLSPDGQPTVLATLWSKRPVVLVFLRQFGCLFCCQQVSRFNEWADEFDRAGLDVVAIGNGRPEMAQRFIERYQPPFPVYADPGRRSYAAAGLHHRYWLSLPTIPRAVRAYRAGYRQSRTAGDPNQQGGVLVVDISGSVLLFHADRFSGDSLDPADVWLRARLAVRAREGSDAA